MNIYIIGVGLIGGSLGLEIQTAFPEAKIWGIDNDKKHLEQAQKREIIHHAATLEAIHNADIVIVAVPVDAALQLLPEILDKIGNDTLVFDVGSTKKQLCERVKNHKNRGQFLAAHPIAGTEFSGPDAAIKGLFTNKVNIICEVEKTSFKLQEKALDLFQKIGMRIRYMNPESHDKHIAYVSHLSHISSFMLGKTVIEEEKNERDIFDMAGSGFASTVRLAKSSPAMWTPIFKHNKDNVIAGLDGYIASLQHFKTLIEEEKWDEIYTEMENTNKIKNILNQIEK